MPWHVQHLNIEYSANLVDLDTTQVLRAAVAALGEVGAYDLPSTKARIRRCDEYAVGHPDTGDAFVAITGGTAGALAGRASGDRPGPDRRGLRRAAATVRHPGDDRGARAGGVRQAGALIPYSPHPIGKTSNGAAKVQPIRWPVWRAMPSRNSRASKCSQPSPSM